MLHVFAMNREPAYFASLKFLIDRFHLKNHDGMQLRS